MKFQYKDDISVETTFTVAKKASPAPAPTVKPTDKPKAPATGDTNNVLPLGILMVTALSALVVLYARVWERRKGYKGKHGN